MWIGRPKDKVKFTPSKKKLMKTYTTLELMSQFAKLKYKWPAFHMVGVRSKADLPDSFDDTFYLLSEVNSTKPLRIVTSCTTNPGVYWLKKKLNPKGTAVLKPGQYLNTWELGKHKGVYEALVQRKPVTVYRDTNFDNKSDEIGMPEDTGYFGINIHRANSSVASSIINQWSAGCQVINDPISYKNIIDECKYSELKEFTYTLLKEF